MTSLNILCIKKTIVTKRKIISWFIALTHSTFFSIEVHTYFLSRYEKQYENGDEETRRAAWEANYDFIQVNKKSLNLLHI